MSGWLAQERADQASERILDAAEELFVERGVAAVGMSEVAAAAGCSRATLYRYFPDRNALRLAYVQRAAAHVGAAIAAEAPSSDVTDVVLTALRLVRASPALSAWFAEDAATAAGQLAGSSSVIAGLVADFSTDPLAGRWLVRAIVSLLTIPGADASDERVLLERFVAPVVVSRVHPQEPSSRTN